MPEQIRVVIPIPLQALARTDREIQVVVDGPASLEAVLEALETRYPMLRGTIRDQVSKQRRPFIRFFACGEDLSMQPTNDPLPECVVSGEEVLRVVGAMAGG
jgi:sulfur-carrier protein